MWTQQTRWFTFGSAVDPRPLKDNVWAICQGDPWAPLAMSGVLAGPLRQIQTRSDIHHVAFIRAYTSTLEGFMAYRQVWRDFEAHGRLRTNHTKTQILHRAPAVEEQLSAAGRFCLVPCYPCFRSFLRFPQPWFVPPRVAMERQSQVNLKSQDRVPSCHAQHEACLGGFFRALQSCLGFPL